MRYIIEQQATAVVLFVGEATSKQDALDQMARDAGAKDYTDLRERLYDGGPESYADPPDMSASDLADAATSGLIITELEPDDIRLDMLLEQMRADDPKLGDWTELPNFGGPEPSSRLEAWSWDENRLIVGSCSSDIQIINRWDR